MIYLSKTLIISSSFIGINKKLLLVMNSNQIVDHLLHKKFSWSSQIIFKKQDFLLPWRLL